MPANFNICVFSCTCYLARSTFLFSFFFSFFFFVKKILNWKSFSYFLTSGIPKIFDTKPNVSEYSFRSLNELTVVWTFRFSILWEFSTEWQLLWRSTENRQLLHEIAEISDDLRKFPREIRRYFGHMLFNVHVLFTPKFHANQIFFSFLQLNSLPIHTKMISVSTWLHQRRALLNKVVPSRLHFLRPPYHRFIRTIRHLG